MSHCMTFLVSTKKKTTSFDLSLSNFHPVSVRMYNIMGEALTVLSSGQKVKVTFGMYSKRMPPLFAKLCLHLAGQI